MVEAVQMVPAMIADPEVRLVSFVHRDKVYYNVKINHNGHEVEVTLSPTGSSTHVFVDNKQWKAIQQ